MNKRQRDKAIKLFPITDDDVHFIGTCADSVWNDIGFDCLENVEGAEMKKADVIEVVMDCDRLREEMKRSLKRSHFRREPSEMLKRLVAAYDDYDSPDWSVACDRIHAALTSYFPCDLFGY